MLSIKPADAHQLRKSGLNPARQRGDRLSIYIALYNLSQVALVERDYSRAGDYLREGIRLSGQTRDVANLAYLFDALAVVESLQDRFVRTATLLGAAQIMREAAGADVDSYYRPDEARKANEADRARVALGVDAYEDTVDAGRALRFDDAVAYALGRAPRSSSAGRASVQATEDQIRPERVLLPARTARVIAQPLAHVRPNRSNGSAAERRRSPGVRSPRRWSWMFFGSRSRCRAIAAIAQPGRGEPAHPTIPSMSASIRYLRGLENW